MTIFAYTIHALTIQHTPNIVNELLWLLAHWTQRISIKCVDSINSKATLKSSRNKWNSPIRTCWHWIQSIWKSRWFIHNSYKVHKKTLRHTNTHTHSHNNWCHQISELSFIHDEKKNKYSFVVAQDVENHDMITNTNFTSRKYIKHMMKKLRLNSSMFVIRSDDYMMKNRRVVSSHNSQTKLNAYE